jgi:hypothetical protein
VPLCNPCWGCDAYVIKNPTIYVSVFCNICQLDIYMSLNQRFFPIGFWPILLCCGKNYKRAFSPTVLRITTVSILQFLNSSSNSIN